VMAPAVHGASGVVLQAVAARDLDRARSLEPIGAVHDATDGYEALLADPEVDLVYVCLSNDLHRPVAEAAMRAGKDVLCEKPLGLDPAEVASMQAVARETGRLLVEGFWSRWHPRQIALEALARSGGLGDLLRVDAGFCFEGDLTGNYRLDGSRGGGAFYDVGCYSVSQAVALLGDLAPRAAQLVEVSLRPGVDVHADALLDFDGPVAEVVGGFLGPESRWTAVVGTSARAALGDPAFNHAPEPEGSDLLVQQLDDAGSGVGDPVVTHFPPADPRRLMLEGVAAVVRGDASADDLPAGAAHSLAVSEGIALVLEEIRHSRSV